MILRQFNTGGPKLAYDVLFEEIYFPVKIVEYKQLENLQVW